MALLSSVIPYSLELEALRRLPVGIFGVLMSMEPAIAALVGLLALDQGLATVEVAGIGMVRRGLRRGARSAAGDEPVATEAPSPARRRSAPAGG